MPLILIVDDNTSLRLFLVELLHDAGYEVAQARDGQEALEQITTDPPDLVLSDIHMPRLDGLSLLQQAQATAPEPRWILMSGTLHRPPQAPVPFLVKPFDVEVLLRLIEDLLAA
jgi:two-component system, NtrC family, response regulator AtoC